MKTAVIVDLHHLRFAETQSWPSLLIQIVAVWDDGIQAVVAAGEFEDDENGVLVGFGGAGRRGEESGHGRAQGDQRRRLEAVSEELATVQHGSSPFFTSRDRQGVVLPAP